MSTTLRIGVLGLSLPLCAIVTYFAVQTPQTTPDDGPAACRNKEGEQVVVVREKDKKATVAKGEILVVKLPAKLGTGYGWKVAKQNETHLKTDGEPKTEDIPDEEVKKEKVGGKQYQVFRFIPGEPGKEKLVMEYRRPFDAETPAKKKYEIEVTVVKSRQ